MTERTNAVTDIDEAIKRIVEQFHPVKIILFGSRAHGQVGPDSDVDLLVVMDVEGSKRRKAVEIDLALSDRTFPLDLICHSLAVPRSHDLVELYHRLASETRPALPEEGLAILNRYAVESRYPGSWEVINRTEAEEAFRIARTLRRAIGERISGMTESGENTQGGF